jgi:uncharacterized protein YjiS (DUF1127 family)
MSLLTLTSLPVRSRPIRPRSGLLATLALWRLRQRTRHQLDGLDDRLLADIGLTWTQQRIECAKAPWQL